MKERTKRVSLFTLIAASTVSLLTSCIRTETKAFSNLFEENVIWSDIDEKIKIFVNGKYNKSEGIAKLTIGGEETTFRASFTSDNLNKAKINFNDFAGTHFDLFFQEAIDETSAAFKVDERLEALGDPAFVEDTPITLKKRQMTKADLDARNFIGYYYATENEELSLLHLKDTPFDGKMVGKYKADLVDFKFLEDDNYEMTTSKGLLGKGKYSTDFEGMTLFFGEYGQEEFGESLWLDGVYNNARSSSN